ncbi:MAG: hypothetical protein AAFR01_02265 [Pseudomonadota bacterium]
MSPEAGRGLELVAIAAMDEIPQLIDEFAGTLLDESSVYSLEFSESLARRLIDKAEDPGEITWALDVLAVILTKAQRLEEALQVSATVCQMLDGLAADDPSRYGLMLATAAQNLGNILTALGILEEAFGSYQVSIGILEKVESEESSTSTKLGLAEAKHNASVALATAGHLDEALRWSREACALVPRSESVTDVRIAKNLGYFSRHLATLLYNLKRSPEAVEPAEEAIAVFRECAAVDPDVFEIELARSLEILAVVSAEIGVPDFGSDRAEEALRLKRSLHSSRPHIMQAELVRSLRVSIKILELQGRMEEARSYFKEIERLES